MEYYTDLDLIRARKALASSDGFGWLLERSARFWWPGHAVQAELKDAGIFATRAMIVRWYRSLPHTMKGSGSEGSQAARDDLIVFFATMIGERKRERMLSITR